MECKPASTPMEANVGLCCDGSHLLDDSGHYRRMNGKLIYLIITRPDITFAVRVLSRFIHQPRQVHWTAALRILVYIKNSPEKGLLYKKHEHVCIFGYSESGYVGDKGDGKSTTSYCTFFREKSGSMEEQKKCCF